MGKNLNPDFFPEEFEKYLSVISPEFPNIPRGAFFEWIYPFWNEHISSLYGNLDFKNLVFSLEDWSASQCLLIDWWARFSTVKSVEENWSLEYFYKVFSFSNDVVSSWRERGTWFKPIWVLNSESFPMGRLHPDIKKPFMLIEGHTRLGTLRLHNKQGLAGPTHKVWVISNKSE
jgi:hypothetical protein